jgi:prevent-host-death family protein
MVALNQARTPETVAISEFKARCLALLERVRRTGQPLIVTRHGRPIAEVVPPSTHRSSVSWLGSAAGSARITGDIIAPAAELDEWEAFRS